MPVDMERNLMDACRSGRVPMFHPAGGLDHLEGLAT
jgi:hypothetical protein